MSEENKDKISRRQFLIDAGLVAGGAALVASCGKTTTETVTNTLTNTATNAVTKTQTATVTPPPAVTVTVTPPMSLTVYEPTGAGAAQITNLYAPRLDTLDNKTIAMMACDASKWQTFRILP